MYDRRFSLVSRNVRQPAEHLLEGAADLARP